MRRPVATVVVTYRSAPEIGACLAALNDALVAGDVIHVVDNASPDRTAAKAAEAVAGLRHGVRGRVTRLPRNLGFGTACNRGVADLPGMDVLLVNPDVLIEGDSVTLLRQALADDPARGAAGPRIERFDGSPERGCRRSLPRPRVAFGRLSRLDRIFPSRFGAYNRLGDDPSIASDIEAGSGCCVLVRREAWDAVHGFDERFFMYAEDLDLFLRLGQLGWTIRYVPLATARHRKGASTQRVRLRMIIEFHRAMWVYCRKHHVRGGAAVLAPAVIAALSIRCGALLAVAGVRRLGQR